MTIGERIKQKRLELNMSQEELAFKCGYKSRSSINKIELARDLPLRKVELVAKALEVEPSYIMGWEEETFHDDLDAYSFGVILADISKNPVLNEAVEKLIRLNPDDQKVVCNLINSLYEKVSQKV